MNNEFIQNNLKRRGRGKKWLGEIPSLIIKIEEEWKIKEIKTFTLSFNYVALVKQEDGSKAVLKLVFPDDLEFKTEKEALELYAGQGATKILNSDIKKHALLLEFIEPGVALYSIEDEEKMTAVIISTMKKLWKSPPKNSSFPHINDWVKGIERYKNKYGEKGPIPKILIEKSEKYFDELIKTTQNEVVCHGDLHHYNILSAQREPWLAIDPKGVIADKAYDTAVMLQNPEKTLIKTILERRIDQMSYELDIPKERILKWGSAHSVLSATWAIEDGSGDGSEALEVANMLEDL